MSNTGNLKPATTTRKAKITTDVVNKLKPGETVLDTEIRGFGVRRQHGKDRIYFVRRQKDGKRQYITIGAHGDIITVAGAEVSLTAEKARDRASSNTAKIAEGHDAKAIRAKEAGMPTVADYCAELIEAKAGILKPGTLKNYRQALRRDIEKHALGALKIDRVTQQDVRKLHGEVLKRGAPRQAKHVVQFLSRAFTSAGDDGLIPKTLNPARGIDFSELAAVKRERFLTTEELDRVGEVLAAMDTANVESPWLLAAIRLLLLTGCRPDEILRLRWEWVDFERAMLNLPDSKTGKKSVHLNPAAATVLQAILRVNGQPYVIEQGKSKTGLRNLWHKVRTLAKLAPSMGPDGKMKEVRVYDLRHTFASSSITAGTHLAVLQKLLGHRNVTTTMRYAHLASDAIRDASNAVGGALAGSIMSKMGGEGDKTADGPQSPHKDTPQS